MWVGIMGPDTHENVGQSQSVLMMINPIQSSDYEPSHDRHPHPHHSCAVGAGGAVQVAFGYFPHAIAMGSDHTQVGPQPDATRRPLPPLAQTGSSDQESTTVSIHSICGSWHAKASPRGLPVQIR
jgi:hypothetical protein